MRRIQLVVLTLLCTLSITYAQDSVKMKKFTLSGYVKYLQTINYQDFNKDWITQNLIHNRLNFSYFANEHLTGVVQIRNRFTYGDFFRVFPGYADYVGQDNGYADMSYNLASGNSYVLNTSIDRLYLNYTVGKWAFTAGRHRINWGQNLIWNPNDVFNAYSYFDFDYEERPGTDAVRIQYFPTYTSTAEFVYAAGKSYDDMSFMGYYRFNRWNYDIQFLGGQVKGDYVLGTGWSGDIAGAGFRGEITWFHPRTSSTGGQVVGSISGDYTFRNSLYIQASVLYNSRGTTGKTGVPNPAVLSEVSARNLTLSRGSLFGEVAYPITPLLKGDLAGIVNPFDGSWFTGPGLTYSLSNNMEVLGFAQVFEGQNGTEFGEIGKLIFLRFKWSF